MAKHLQLSAAATSAPKVDGTRAAQEIQARFNPLRNFTPQKVVRLLEDYDRGIYREAAWMMDKVERVDDMCQTVAPKRRKALAGLDWSVKAYESWEEIGTDQQLAEQTAFIRHLLNSITTTHALDRNTTGGLRRIIEQMADAIGKGYAAHEIQWRPRKDGLLEASLMFVPLWFFENQTGRLRFLQHAASTNGEDLDPLGWMVTSGQGIMYAVLSAYTFKTIPMKDWLLYSGRAGLGIPSMSTDAAPGSKQWHDELDALATISSRQAFLHSRNSEFNVHSLNSAGELPFPKLVERMDRAISMLWRGADLSTMSGDDRHGASLQQAESDILLDDDVLMVNETIEQSLILPALRWRFGSDVRPMAYFALHAPDRTDEKAEQEKMHGAADYGVTVPVSDYRERLGIPGGEDDEDAVLTSPKTTRQEPANPFAALANQARPAAPADHANQLPPADSDPEDRFRRNALLHAAEGIMRDLREPARRLAEIADIEDEVAAEAALRDLRRDLDEWIQDDHEDDFTAALEEILGTALLNGVIEGAEETFLENPQNTL